jgi:hypothetical protein
LADPTIFSLGSILFRSLDDLDGTVIVTMITMRMMQVPIDQIINVVTMRNRFVPTARTMFVVLVVAATDMVVRAPVGILRADIYYMLFNEH